MPGGSEELFVTRGWLEPLSLSGSCRRQEKHCALTEEPLPPRIALHTAPMLLGGEGLRKVPGWGDCLEAGRLGGGRGVRGEDGGWEGGELFGRVCGVRELGRTSTASQN